MLHQENRLTTDECQDVKQGTKRVRSSGLAVMITKGIVAQISYGDVAKGVALHHPAREGLTRKAESWQ